MAQAPADVGDGLPDTQHAADRVDVGPAQAEGLAAAHAGEGHELVEGWQPVAGGRVEEAELVGLPQHDLHRLNGWSSPCAGLPGEPHGGIRTRVVTALLDPVRGRLVSGDHGEAYEAGGGGPSSGRGTTQAMYTARPSGLRWASMKNSQFTSVASARRTGSSRRTLSA